MYEYKAAMKVQKRWRGRKGREIFFKLLQFINAALVIQRCMRGRMARSTFVLIRKNRKVHMQAAKRIQVRHRLLIAFVKSGVLTNVLPFLREYEDGCQANAGNISCCKLPASAQARYGGPERV
jgi:hypothetical protein